MIQFSSIDSLVSRNHVFTDDPLEVTDADSAVKVYTERPHLVSLGSGRLSTAVTLHPLLEGRTEIGTSESPSPPDIVIQGTGVEAEHCYIDNIHGTLTLNPIAKLCSVDGRIITEPTRLTQGCMLCLGRSNYFRFNHPKEAKQIKEALPNCRISCAPLHFLQDLEENPEYMQVMSEAAQNVQRRSSSGSDRGSFGSRRSKGKSPKQSLVEEGEEEFLNKVCKFELISRGKTSPASPKSLQNSSSFLSGSPLSPKQHNTHFFPAGKHPVTVSHTSPSSRFGESKQFYSNVSNISPIEKKPERPRMNPDFQYSGEKVFSKETATTRLSASILRGNTGSAERVVSTGSTSSGGSLTSVSSVSGTILSWNSDSSKSNESVSSSKTLQTSSPKVALSPKKNITPQNDRGYQGMNSMPSGTDSKSKAFMNGQISHGFDLIERNLEKYVTENHRNTFDGMDFDFNELTASQQDLSIKHQEMVAERKKEQEMEKIEKQRLEEILSMCAEYERQIQEEKTQNVFTVAQVQGQTRGLMDSRSPGFQTGIPTMLIGNSSSPGGAKVSSPPFKSATGSGPAPYENMVFKGPSPNRMGGPVNHVTADHTNGTQASKTMVTYANQGVGNRAFNSHNHENQEQIYENCVNKSPQKVSKDPYVAVVVSEMSPERFFGMDKDFQPSATSERVGGAKSADDKVTDTRLNQAGSGLNSKSSKVMVNIPRKDEVEGFVNNVLSSSSSCSSSSSSSSSSSVVEIKDIAEAPSSKGKNSGHTEVPSSKVPLEPRDHVTQPVESNFGEQVSITGAKHVVRPTQLSCVTSTTTDSPDGTNSGSLERKDKSDPRGSMSKIKTNGSLAMINSPGSGHKDFSGFQIKRCSSNSSNSEEESTSNSEDTGTIKRRPVLHGDQVRWKDTLSDDRSRGSRSSPEEVKCGHFSPIMGSRSPKIGRRHLGKHDDGSNHTGGDNVLLSSMRKKSDENSNVTKTVNFAPTATTLSPSSKDTVGSENGSCVEYDTLCMLPTYQNGNVRLSQECPKFPVMDYNSIYENVDSYQVAATNFEQTKSSASAPTSQDQKSNGVSTIKTPETFSSSTGDDYSQHAVEFGEDGSIKLSEDGDAQHHLEALKQTKAQLLQKINALKQQILEIETQENETIRELEMEKALLEGEHQTELQELQSEQQHINVLKKRQQELVEKATAQREQEIKQIEEEREKLLDLERRHQEMEQLVSACEKDQEARLRERLQREQEMLESQRRLFDDLEFQQLESEATFEEEKEKLQRKLIEEQNSLLEKYKSREDRIQQIDSQQREMLNHIKSDMQSMEARRRQLVEEFRKEKKKLSSAVRKIQEISQSLSLPLNEDSLDSRSPEGQKNSGGMQRGDSITSLPKTPSLRSVDLSFLLTPVSLPANPDLMPLDVSGSPDNSSFDNSSFNSSSQISSSSLVMSWMSTPSEESGQGERKLSSTLQEIEKNRYLFMEQQGNTVIENEKKRIEELKRRAADEGRAQFEERKLREANCKSFNSLESEDSSAASSCETPSEKETR